MGEDQASQVGQEGEEQAVVVGFGARAKNRRSAKVIARQQSSLKPANQQGTTSRHTYSSSRDSLVLGIPGRVVCGPLGIVAWVMGSRDLKEMDAGTMDPAGRGTAQAGKICGIIATIMLILADC